jgi:pantothenate kinase
LITFNELVETVDTAGSGAGLTMIGLVGPPGSGKSTMATRVAEELGPRAVVVGMDGFHLSSEMLERLALADVKGAPQTFDAVGFVHLLERIRHRSPGVTIHAPTFDRDREEPIAAGVAVTPEHEIVVVEGNYLLLDGPWRRIGELLDLVVYVDLDPSVRRARLVARHMGHGRTAQQARAWVDRSDEANAVLIEATRDRADWCVPGP